MANTFSPFGFRSFGRQEGGAPTAGLTQFAIASSDTNTYFTGDVVAQSTSIPGYISTPSSGTAPVQPILGIFAGCEYYSATVGRVVWNSYFPGSVGSSSPCKAYVYTDPEQLFLVQSSTTAVLGSSNTGQLIGYASSLQASGNTTTGISYLALNSTTSNSSTSSLPFRIVDISGNHMPPGVNGTSTDAGAIMVVSFNNQYRRTLTTASS